MPVRNKLSEISLGSPNILTSRPDGPPWMNCTDDAAKDKQGDDRGGGFGFVHGDAED